MTPLSPTPRVSEAMVEIALNAWAEAGRHSRWPVQGLSMWPLLQPGDVVEVAHGRQGIREGDVLLYQAEGRVVVHRLLRGPRGPLRRSGGWLLLGSDHLPTADALVPMEAIVGRVIVIHTPAGRLALTSRAARWPGRLIAACHPWRSCWSLRRLVRLLAHVQRWVLRT